MSLAKLHSVPYFFKAYGCQMNASDAEHLCGLLNSLGAVRVAEVKDAQIAIYLTCCVRESADTKELGQIASIKNIPTPNGDKRIVAVGGCMGARDGDELKAQLPFVDIVFGTKDFVDLPEQLVMSLRGAVGDKAIHSSVATYDLPIAPDLPHKRFITITEGCDNFCTYCIVPYVRGREQSRDFSSILAEVNEAIANGVKEITLLGQNVNSYQPSFTELLQAVAETGVARLRFVTSNPHDLAEDIIQIIGRFDNIMPALHLPLQSGSNQVLSDMHRKYTREHYLELVQKLRAVKPQLAISTDIIVGFPTETEQDCADTMELVEQVGFASAYTFIYNKRSGTKAAELESISSDDGIHSRFDQLVQLVTQQAQTYNAQFKDTVQPVLVDQISKKDNNVLSGYTPYNQLCHVDISDSGGANKLIGQIVPVQIIETAPWYIKGKIEL